MIEDRLEQMQSAIEQSSKISGDTKAELLALVAGLRAEIKTLSETHHEEASSITRFADEAARSQENPQGSETALDSLRGSIQGFEDSHPKLVETVNRFATALSNMGL
jgi:uncharacterized protein YukE